MSRTVRSLLTLSLLCAYGMTFVGCKNDTPALPPSVTPPPADGDHASHDHEDGDGHDHPEHGPRGGHMIEMSDGTEVEVQFADDVDMFTVFPVDPGAVKKVVMAMTIDGKESDYEFEKQPTFDSVVYTLTSPELSTAAKVGEGVDIELTVTTEEGDATGKFEHHAH